MRQLVVRNLEGEVCFRDMVSSCFGVYHTTCHLWSLYSQALGPALLADGPAESFLFQLCPGENIISSTARHTLVAER